MSDGKTKVAPCFQRAPHRAVQSSTVQSCTVFVLYSNATDKRYHYNMK